MSIFRTKSIEQSLRDTDEPGTGLRKNLSAFHLTVFGVGVIIGTGIFVLTGQQAARNAGPAIVLSFALAGVVCALAALCYAEFASSVPVAGSAYTFSYATLGQFVAWIIGWDLCLELALGAAVVSRGWSAYLQELLDLPTWLGRRRGDPRLRRRVHRRRPDRAWPSWAPSCPGGSPGCWSSSRSPSSCSSSASACSSSRPPTTRRSSRRRPSSKASGGGRTAAAGPRRDHTAALRLARHRRGRLHRLLRLHRLRRRRHHRRGDPQPAARRPVGHHRLARHLRRALHGGRRSW